MTHNQIAYQANLLQEAHNLEAARHNRETEQVSRYVAEVQDLYNRAQVEIAKNRLVEEARHNREQEAIGRIQANVASGTLLLNSRIADETARHNLAYESETATHNRNAEAESQRSNMAREAEEVRSNKAREEETSKHNLRSDFINAVRAGTDIVGTAFNGLRSITSAINPFQLLN